MTTAILPFRPPVHVPTAPTSYSTPQSLHCERMSVAMSNQPSLATRWLEWTTRRPGTPLELHPNLLGQRATHARLLWGESIEGGLLDLAALVEKPIRLPSLPGCPRFPALRGARWVGRRLVDQASETFVHSAVDVIASLVANDFDAVLFEDLETESPLWRAIQARDDVRVLELAAPQVRWRMRLPASAEVYWSGFSSKTRYNFRRAKRLLSHDWSVVEDAEDVPEFLAAAEKVSRSSWQDRRIGPRIRQDQATREQFRQLADMGALRCCLLHSQGEPIAFAIGTQWAGQYQLEEIGYDARFADFSPGTILLLNLIDDLFARRTPAVLDFGFGDGAYKKLFGNEQTESGTLLLTSRRLRPALISLAHQIAGQTQQLARRWSDRIGAARLVRRWYRNQ